MNNAICTVQNIMEVILNIYHPGIIYQTTNYAQFVITRKNRPISGRKVLESIKRKNLLPEKPILVTSDLIVLDGQHRLRAAEALNLDIYFQIARKNVTDEDLAALNVQKSWEIINYINLYYDKNDNYNFLQHLLETYNLTPYVSFIITIIGAGSNCKNSFKEGDYKLKESKISTEERIKKISECRDEIIKRFNNHKIVTVECLHALYQLTKYAKYDHNKLLRIIRSNKYKDALFKTLEFRRHVNIYSNLKKLLNPKHEEEE